MLLTWQDYELDEERFELRREGVKVPVQPKVLDLLFHVVRARDRVVLRRELLDTVWSGVAVSEASLSRAVLEARRAIGDELQQVLVTVRGRGFRFVVDVVEKAQDLTDAPAREAAIDPTFVGRTSCMTCLEARLEEAATQHGGLVWISGEAGIGKTRVADEFARRARGRGATAYSASAHETPAAPQFWLWAQFARAHAAAHPGPKADRFLESMVPLLTGATELSSEAQFVLFDAFTRFFIEASHARPLVLVLDDAHWADDGSRRLLQFFAREARHAAIVIVCTYRDTELAKDARGQAFGALLGECAGLAIPLRGLSRDDIPRFVEVASGSTPSQHFVEALHERTGGSPLYLRQVLQTEWAERALSENARVLASSMDIQQGLVESIRRHVDGVSREAHDLLTLAAVLGREFEFTELALVSGLDHAEILNRLDEAARARILLKSKTGAYRFTHVLVHEVLYKSLSSAARASKHALIAERLLAHYGASLEVHAAHLAFHFIRALPGGSAARALELSIRAAEQESARGEHGNAARHWNEATQALAHLATDDPRHMRAKLGSAQAHALAHEDSAARDAFLDVALLARTFGDAEMMTEAALGFAALTEPSVVARQRLLGEAREMLLSVKGESAALQRRRIDAALASSSGDGEVTSS